MKEVNDLCFRLATLAVSASLSSSVHAAITAPITLTFSGFPTALYGASNVEALANGNCPIFAEHGACYYEKGMAVGVVDDNVGYGEHLHRAAFKAQYHADSSGIYIRAIDGSAFSLNEMLFQAPIGGDNPGYYPVDNELVAGDFWEILGFNTAANPNLRSGDGTHYATRIAYQEVANGFDGILSLNADFHNINAFWIHFKGYPGIPQDGVSFGMTLDNVKISAPVPLPAAAWMFGAGLLGLASSAGKKRPLLTRTAL